MGKQQRLHLRGWSVATTNEHGRRCRAASREAYARGMPTPPTPSRAVEWQVVKLARGAAEGKGRGVRWPPTRLVQKNNDVRRLTGDLFSRVTTGMMPCSRSTVWDEGSSALLSVAGGCLTWRCAVPPHLKVTATSMPSLRAGGRLFVVVAGRLQSCLSCAIFV